MFKTGTLALTLSVGLYLSGSTNCLGFRLAALLNKKLEQSPIQRLSLTHPVFSFVTKCPTFKQVVRLSDKLSDLETSCLILRQAVWLVCRIQDTLFKQAWQCDRFAAHLQFHTATRKKHVLHAVVFEELYATIESPNDKSSPFSLTHSDIACEVHMQPCYRCGTSLIKSQLCTDSNTGLSLQHSFLREEYHMIPRHPVRTWDNMSNFETCCVTLQGRLMLGELG